MASTVPAKTHALHNFALSHLKWSKTDNSASSSSSSADHPQRRRTSSIKSPSNHHQQNQSQSPSHSSQPHRHRNHSPMRDPPPPRHQQSPMRDPSAPPPLLQLPRQLHSPMRGDAGGQSSPMRSVEAGYQMRGESASETDLSQHKHRVGTECKRFYSRNPTMEGSNRGVYTSVSDRLTLEKSDKKAKGLQSEAMMVENNNSNSNGKEGRSKILIKLPPRKNKAAMNMDEVYEEGKLEEENQGEGKTNGTVDSLTNNFEGDEMNEEMVPKTWNLRPRKPIRKSLNVNGVGAKGMNGSALQENKTQSPQRLNGVNNGNRAEGDGEKKRKISIPLTREEIEEDVFVMTGCKPARRPKKRAKVIQKQLDNLFPGLWLTSVTPDMYKVPDYHAKG